MARNGNGRYKGEFVEAPAGKIIRCAIYTRKSTEEGLEQDFNSLDAQREAGEAFIASQRHEGLGSIRMAGSPRLLARRLALQGVQNEPELAATARLPSQPLHGRTAASTRSLM